MSTGRKGSLSKECGGSAGSAGMHGRAVWHERGGLVRGDTARPPGNAWSRQQCRPKARRSYQASSGWRLVVARPSRARRSAAHTRALPLSVPRHVNRLSRRWTRYGPRWPLDLGPHPSARRARSGLRRCGPGVARWWPGTRTASRDQLTAERLNARIEIAVSAIAHRAMTAMLSHASAVTLCIPQMSCRLPPLGSMNP